MSATTPPPSSPSGTRPSALTPPSTPCLEADVPILASLRAVRSSRPRPVIDPDRRTLDFASVDGEDVLVFDGDTYVIAPGVQGLEVPPRTVTIDQYPGLDGGRLRSIATNAREVAI